MEKKMDTPLMFFDKCRLCLFQEGVNNIFGGNDLAQDIFTYIGVKVKKSDDLPQKICFQCLEVIEKVKNLRADARSNDALYRSLFGGKDEESELKEKEKRKVSPSIKENSQVTVAFVENKSSTSKKSNRNLKHHEVNNTTRSSTSSNVVKNKSSTSEKSKRNLKHHEVNNTTRSSTSSNVVNNKSSTSKKSNRNLKHHEVNETTRSSTSSNVDSKEKRAVADTSSKRKNSDRKHREIKRFNRSSTSSNQILISSPKADEKKEAQPPRHKLIKKDGHEEYICGVCDKHFKTWKKLYLHNRFHNKKLMCPLDACGKMFANKGDLEKHLRSHTGVKPYSCEVCSKSFTQNVTLKVHKETVHSSS